jgi:3-oxoacyl-[acyl-carrier-protein] synthase III
MAEAQIVSTGAYLPGEPITNAELERLAGPLAEEVLAGIRVTQRHWLVHPATGEHRESNSDMAAKAARQALNRAGMSVDDVDLLVTCTGSPEFAMPPMAGFLQDKLGLARCTAIEIRGGCAGSLQALDVARLYIEQGGHRTALVVGSEAISPAVVPLFLGQDPSSLRMRDRLAVYLFGDGAGALALRASENGEGFLGSVQRSVGGGRRPGMQVVGGGTHAPIQQQRGSSRPQEIRMNVGDIDRMTPHLVAEGLAETLECAGVDAGSIDVCILPEGGEEPVTDALRAAGLLSAQWQELAGKIVENTPMVGATGAATMPLALDYAYSTGRVNRGDRVMLLAVETTKWLYGGMVLTWTVPPLPAEDLIGPTAASLT